MSDDRHDLVLGAGRGGLDPDDRARLRELVEADADAAELLAWIRTLRGTLEAGAFGPAAQHRSPDCPDEATLAGSAVQIGRAAADPAVLERIAGCPACCDAFAAALEELAGDAEEDLAAGAADRARLGERLPAPPAALRPGAAPTGLARRWPGFLAAAVLLAAALYFVRDPLSGPDPANPARDSLVALAEVEPLPVRTLRSTPSDDFELLRAGGLEAYAAGSFAEARDDLHAALAIDAGHPDLWLMLGSAELLLDHPGPGLEALATALAQGEGGPVAHEARWLSAQAALLLGDAPSAERHLTGLLASPGPRAEGARAQLEALRAH